MRKIISFNHISLDGFVASEDGELNWVKIDDEIFNFVAKRILKGDSALYGRKTYQLMESYWPKAGEKVNATNHEINHSNWYNKMKKIVLSNTLQNDKTKNLTVINDNLKESLNKIKEQDGEDILLFGSPSTTHSLLGFDLIDGYWLFVNPTILGKGIPLFKHTNKTNLKLVGSSHKFASGVTELNYLVER